MLMNGGVRAVVPDISGGAVVRFPSASVVFFFFQAADGIRDTSVTGVQTCALPIFTVGPITPLVVRGPAPVLSWVPPKLPPVGDNTTMRLLDLYRHTDPTFARVLEERIGLAAIARAGGMNSEPGEDRPVLQGGGIAQVRAYFADAAGAAANFLAEAEGPRVGALAFDGWDTHVNEGI